MCLHMKMTSVKGDFQEEMILKEISTDFLEMSMKVSVESP